MALLNEHRQHMTANPPPIYAKSNELNSIALHITASYEQLQMDAVAAQQNLQCLVDLLAAYQVIYCYFFRVSFPLSINFFPTEMGQRTMFLIF